MKPNNEMDEETFELARDYDLEYDDAIRLKEVMDEHDLDADEAMELKDDLD